MDIENIIDKLKDILSNEMPNKKVFDKDVAAALNLSKESLSMMKKSKSIPYEQIAKFCAIRKISINWVLFDQMPKSLEIETEKYAKVKFFNKVNASAGGGAINYEDNFEYIEIDRELIDSLYKSNLAKEDSLFAIKIIGDSMESTLFNEDVILVDNENIDIQKEGIFVITINNALFVKRVEKIDNYIELISDNKSYSNERIYLDDVNDFRILGKVLGVLHINF